jgi:predicted neutral ceramidase superfamily lipid hydrolase
MPALTGVGFQFSLYPVGPLITAAVDELCNSGCTTLSALFLIAIVLSILLSLIFVNSFFLNKSIKIQLYLLSILFLHAVCFDHILSPLPSRHRSSLPTQLHVLSLKNKQTNNKHPLKHKQQKTQGGGT